MSSLFASYTIKNKIIRNRVVFPPVVCFNYTGEEGFVTDRSVEHYRLRAEGGAGIVITEATAVFKDGRLAPFQIGIWSDDHIPGLSRISTAVKHHGALSLLQIHHAGLITPEPVHPDAFGPSVDVNNHRSRELTVEMIREVKEAFISGAYRAQQAGFDGIELHGAHGYLLNQFASSYFNHREDEWGKDRDGRLRLATEIIEGIRSRCGEEFIIGYRMGANSPTLDEGIEIAKQLESKGVDILHVSHGGNLQNLPRTAKDFPFNWIVYSGIMVKASVKVPVIAVNEIKNSERSEWLIDKGRVDFVALGRPQLADPAWSNHVKDNLPINICSTCKPKCRWYETSDLCPAVIRLKSKVETQQ